MNKRPEQTPEGKLIAAAADRLDLSIREAARRAGISYGRWRQIVTGYQNVSPGSYAAVHAPARTLAKMAAVVSVTPAELTGAGREDAARVLEEIQRHHDVAAPERPVRTRVNPSLRRTPELIPYIHKIAEELAAGEGPESERVVWENDLMSDEEKWNFLAMLRHGNDTSASESSTGLSLSPNSWFSVTARSRRPELARYG